MLDDPFKNTNDLHDPPVVNSRCNEASSSNAPVSDFDGHQGSSGVAASIGSKGESGQGLVGRGLAATKVQVFVDYGEGSKVVRCSRDAIVASRR